MFNNRNICSANNKREQEKKKKLVKLVKTSVSCKQICARVFRPVLLHCCLSWGFFTSGWGRVGSPALASEGLLPRCVTKAVPWLFCSESSGDLQDYGHWPCLCTRAAVVLQEPPLSPKNEQMYLW